ncbi:nucleotidyltransferase substrate-binding protein [Clostridium sp. CAG:967]|nr:nucleotidyltransferase substrate-binding protein [Clostridium sp. CAG:967]
MSIDLSNLKSALKTLKSSMVTLDANKSCDFSDMLEDSCIKRFEYTLEISRKLMKKILKKIYGKSEEELTVNNTFRFMQGYKFIPNWENWREYYEKRNNTAHEYNLEKSRKLIEIIPDFINDTEILVKNMDEKLPND